MSHMGLYSGLSARVRQYPKHLDQVIIRLKSGESKPTDPGRRRLAALLLEVEKSIPTDLSSQLLAVLVREQDAGRPGRWSEVGEGRSSLRMEDPQVIERLELLAMRHRARACGDVLEDAGAGELNEYFCRLRCAAHRTREAPPPEGPPGPAPRLRHARPGLQAEAQRAPRPPPARSSRSRSIGKRTISRQRLRSFKRIVAELDMVETVGVAALDPRQARRS